MCPFARGWGGLSLIVCCLLFWLLAVVMGSSQLFSHHQTSLSETTRFPTPSAAMEVVFWSSVVSRPPRPLPDLSRRKHFFYLFIFTSPILLYFIFRVTGSFRFFVFICFSCLFTPFFSCFSLSSSRNVTYIPSNGQNILLNLKD